MRSAPFIQRLQRGTPAEPAVRSAGDCQGLFEAGVAAAHSRLSMAKSLLDRIGDLITSLITFCQYADPADTSEFSFCEKYTLEEATPAPTPAPTKKKKR